MPAPRKVSAASGASGKANANEFTDGVPKHMAEIVNAWSKWRADNPVRGNEGEGACNFFDVLSRPPKATQLPWCAYLLKKQQECLYVPLLVDCGGQKTQPLAGAPVEAELMQVVDGAGKHMEHYANIHRIKHLAKEHPLVAEVEEHNE